VLKILDFFNYAQSESPWIVHFCSGCCSLEMAAATGPRYDWERYGYMQTPTPRQADVMIITGLVSKKILPALLRTFAQMPEPSYVLAIGACAYDGGPYNESVSVIKNMTEILPADAFVAGCPPKPEAIITGLDIIKEKMRKGEPSAASQGGLWKQMNF
jgi:NADH-quinone oxidoreductase subunit B